jgi:hypothetical protein
MAQALCNELGGQFVYADAQAPGEPRIQVGKVVNVTDMGKYTGKYYVTESRHVYYQGIYTTEFSVRGLREGSILNTLSPPTRLKPGQTNLVGIVTDNNDPKGLGRVRVQFPTLNPETSSKGHESWWARVVGLGAGGMGLGKTRGFHCLPEINDEVLVAFEHGDIHRPYVIGGVWNGKEKPPDTVKNTVFKGKVRLRTFKTRTGHYLQFVEEDKLSSKAGIYIRSSKKHQIRINDSDRFIEIKTAGGHRIKMDDRLRSITIHSTGTISMDAPRDISIRAGGLVNISAGANVGIRAGGAVNAQAGGLIGFTAGGAVTAQAATAISLTAAAAVTAQAGAAISLTAGAAITAQAIGTIGLTSPVSVLFTAPLVKVNGIFVPV